MVNHKKQSAFALGFALVLTFGITLIKGGAPQWASLSWVSLSGLALLLVMAGGGLSQCRLFINPTKEQRRILLPACLFITFQLWVFLQFIIVTPDKPASLEQGMIGLGMAFLLGIWYSAVNHPKALTLLFGSIVLSAAIQSIYGLWVFLSDADLLLWMPKLYYLDRPTGFFVNANHFAAYLVLSIILCLSHKLGIGSGQTNSTLLMRVFDQLYSPINAILCFLLIALIASKSIGAMVSLSVVIALIGVTRVWRSQYRKTLILSFTVLILILTLFVLSLDYITVEREAAEFLHTLTRRLELSKAAFSMLQENWLMGIGGGTFYSQFSPHRTLEIGNSYYNYAHNDILQFWIEYGIIGITLLLLFVTTVIRDNIRVLTQSQSGIQATFAYASIYSTVAVAAHSLVDFPLHIPGFSVCYLVIISINSLSLISQALRRDVTNKR